MKTVAKPSNGSRCRGSNRFGRPCGRLAVSDGFCTAHGPNAQDMAELGRRGGQARPQTALRRAASVDDALREKARGVLERALAGEDVPKSALDSARSLFAYRPSPAPTDGARLDAEGRPPKIVHLGDLVEVGVECGLVTAENGGAILVEGRRLERTTPTPTPGEESSPRPLLGPQRPQLMNPRRPSATPSGRTAATSTRAKWRGCSGATAASPPPSGGTPDAPAPTRRMAAPRTLSADSTYRKRCKSSLASRSPTTRLPSSITSIAAPGANLVPDDQNSEATGPGRNA